MHSFPRADHELSEKYRHLFTSPPTFDEVDLLEARIT